MNSYRKPHAAAKDVLIQGKELESKVLSTMHKIASIVGATLGPGGRPVLIERQEYGLANLITKDGVTVFRHLGFQDPTAEAIMTTARDAATRTVSEAGDGTTTATVLAESIVRHTSQFCKNNPKVSPQKVVMCLESLFQKEIEPKIKEWSIKPDETMLKSVAKLSANGDEPLADIVMQCFDVVGDDGAISIVEQSGPSSYQMESMKGFPIPGVGFEESCAKFHTLFINDKANNRCYLERPVFVLYYGAITQVQTYLMLMEKIGQAWEHPENFGLNTKFNHNVVLVATGFSEDVLAQLGANFKHPATINVYPLTTPKSPILNGELHFLHDLAAVTGATVFDPITNPLDNADLKDLGYGVDAFEANRFRSTVIGLCDEDLVLMRAEEVRRAVDSAESRLDKNIITERLARLTGGVAKLKVIGASNGELREKRDRAEDAICAVRGARTKGCLPGGGWTLSQLINHFKQMTYGKISEEAMIIENVLMPSLAAPINLIFKNIGMSDEEITPILNKLQSTKDLTVYDGWNRKYVNAIEGGILDSTPAVLESLRNSLSIASILGTIGGTIVFKRDDELERREAQEAEHFMKAFNGGEES